MINLLGFDIIDCSKREYIGALLEGYSRNSKKVIISGNPEILHTASRDAGLAALFRESDIIPDGIGVLAAGRITGQPVKEKIAGIEVMEEILKNSAKLNMKVYLLGAEEWVVKRAAEICSEKYGAVVSGFKDGYFDLDNCGDILEDINKSGAGVLFVAMGCPRQEKFIIKYKDTLNCKIYMGVGGSFDVLAGKTSRAPEWMIRSGLEWLYRVSREPARIWRLSTIPAFLLSVIIRNRKLSRYR